MVNLEIISWVLSFGPDVIVISPEWLKKKITQRAQKIVDAN
ncbi:MAG TPA: WYL domain-containing protein [Candidatus Mailhella merdavium]|nr:WYL domain-containing protein [Candidatus Mailhella merdavium]